VWGESAPVPTRDLFDVEVFAANKFRLIPRTELAKSLLSMWLCGDVRVSLSDTMQQGVSGAYGNGVRYLELTHETRPMLAHGDDPYYTGMALKPDEVEAVRKYIDNRRKRARR
jgi:hypothetical protein